MRAISEREGLFQRKIVEKMNPHAMNRIMRQRQLEIRRKAVLQRRRERADREYRMWAVERSVVALLSLVLPGSLIGIFILM